MIVFLQTRTFEITNFIDTSDYSQSSKAFEELSQRQYIQKHPIICSAVWSTPIIESMI